MVVYPEIYILNETFERFDKPIDIFSSLQWMPAYNDVGSWEIQIPIRFFNLVTTGTFIENTADKDHFGVIEYIEKITNDDGSEDLTVRGRMAESILDRRILGDIAIQQTFPENVIADLVDKNMITTTQNRIVPEFQIGTIAESNVGNIDYASIGQNLLDEVIGIAKSSQLGFKVYLEDDENVNTHAVFSVYKGVNRTEEDNTQVIITTNPIPNLISNGRFINQLSGWRTRNYGITAERYTLTGEAQYRVKKTKLWDRYWWPEDPEEGEEREYIEEPLYAGYVYQAVNLNKNHLYYMAASVQNPTNTVLSCGIELDGRYQMNFSNTKNTTVRMSTLFVPKANGQQNFVLGIGDFPDDEASEGMTAYVYEGLMVDLTEEFGAGYEPTLDWCDRFIVWNGSNLQYHWETIEKIPNTVDPLVFSRDRDNVLQLEYQKNTVTELTEITVKGEGDIVVKVQSDESVSGLKLKEGYVDVSSDIPRTVNDVELPYQSYVNMLNIRAQALLSESTVNECINISLYLLSNFQYKKDFFLGDIVSCTDKRTGISINLRITQVNEVWDINGYTIGLTLGEPVPQIFDRVKFLAKGVR